MGKLKLIANIRLLSLRKQAIRRVISQKLDDLLLIESCFQFLGVI